MSASSPPPEPPAAPRRRVWPWALLALAALVSVASLLASSSVFDARRIEVEGNRRRSTLQLLALARITPTTNVLWLDAAEAARRLERDPWVAEASVHRSLPSTVRITVVERTPAAVVRSAVSSLLVADDGTVLGPLDAEPGTAPGLPVIAGPGSLPSREEPSEVRAALALRPMDAALRARVRRITVGTEGSVTLRLRSGTLVRYGPVEETERKAAAIEGVVEWAIENGRPLATIDVRAPEAPTAEPAR